MEVLPLQPVSLPRGVQRDACLPTLKRVKSGHVHPMRAHCFARSRTRYSFTSEQLKGVEALPDTAATYVYEMEANLKDTKTRHADARNIKFDFPLAKGLLAKGYAYCMRVLHGMLSLSRVPMLAARRCRVCSTARR